MSKAVKKKRKPGRKPGPEKVQQMISLTIPARDKLHQLATKEGVEISEWVQRKIERA